MRYVELTVEEAMKRCKKNSKVLVAIQDLEEEQPVEILFIKKDKDEYDKLFDGVKTALSVYDDLDDWVVKQLRLYTAKQDIKNVRPVGIQRTILLRE